jgi:3-hydroxyisobutyrate dehydrogenase
MNVGWIGIGRMGLPMVVRLLKAGYPLKVWNRTRSKAAPLAAQGATVVDTMRDLHEVDVLFTMISTGKDLVEICFGEDGLAADGAGRRPGIIVDCSSIGMDESKDIRTRLAAREIQYLAAPVSGNPKCVAAGKLSSVVSGSKPAFDKVQTMIEAYAPRGVAYVGEGDLARVCKIAHNVMLATIMENLIEVTLMAQKAGVPRHAFLRFMNNSVAGSIFTQYKSPALVNLDWTTTFTAGAMLKDIDLGLETARKLGLPVPVTAAVREVFQSHIGAAANRADAQDYLQKDFAALFETMAGLAGVTPTSEDVEVPSGLEA